jgi:hypothetical protein
MDDRFCLVPSKVQIKSERGAGKAEKIVLKKFKHSRSGGAERLRRVEKCSFSATLRKRASSSEEGLRNVEKGLEGFLLR